jgi:simple sugar transport system permease protein
MKPPQFRLLKQALAVIVRIVVALLATVLIVAALTSAVKVPPIAALSALGGGAVGSPFAWSGSLLRATPILLTGLAVAWGFRCGLFNIGAEGQLLWGAIAAAWVGVLPGIPEPLRLSLALLAGAAAGALWAAPAALLKARRGTPEVLTTLLLSFIAEHATTYLANGPLHGADQQGARTADLLPSAWLPPIETAGLRLHWGLPLAVLAALVLAVVLRRARFGFQVQLVGGNPEAARTAGISVPRIWALTLLQSGALAGLAGAVQILGSLHYFQARFSPGYGYEGIPVAILGASHPLGVVLAALFWGGLANGAVEMESAVGVSRYLVVVIQSLVVLAVAARRWPFALTSRCPAPAGD